jgi:iron complex transport system substrate-binding protein
MTRPPARIVSLAPSNTEILYALGAGERVAAVTALCDYPPEAREKPKVGGWTNADLGKVVELAPDLVLTSTFLQDKIAGELRSRGLNVLHVRPFNLQQVVESFVEIGKAVGAEGEGRALAKRALDRLERVHYKVAACPCGRQPRVYLEEWSKPPMVSGNWVPELVELAGGKPGLAKAGEPSYAFRLEDLQKFDPEVILLNVCGAGERSRPELIPKREGWEGLAAVKTGSVFAIDDSVLNRPGPRLAEGAERIARLLHPEAWA